MKTGQQNHIGLDEFQKNINRILSFIHQSLNYCDELGLDETLKLVAQLNEVYEGLLSQNFDKERAKFLVMETFKKQVVAQIQERKKGGTDQ